MVFCFKHQQERKINSEAVEKLRIDQSQIRNLKQGKMWSILDGETISNAQVTHDPNPSKSYAFCSDTAYHPAITQQINEWMSYITKQLF